MAVFPDYERYDALGLAELVAREEVRPRELVEAAIERIEARDGLINAVVHRAFSQGLAAADRPLPEGPFRGVPFLLKDLGTLAGGMPATWGSRFLRVFVPDRDGELVDRFRRAGLILLGKTNTPELGTAFFTEPELFGPTRNPWDPARSPGGSSGGSGAAVAAGYVPMAHASDGGGSIRVPASACGLFGLKPTRGRTPAGDDRGEFWFGLGTDLVVSRSVRDSAAALDALDEPPPGRPFREEVGADPGTLRIAVSTEPICGSSMHAECVRAVEEAAALCELLGHRLEEVRLPVDGQALTRTFLILVAAGVSQDLAYLAALAGRSPARGEIEPVNRVLAVIARRFGAAELAAALTHMGETTRRMEAFFGDHDVLLTPTMAEPPIEVGSLQPTRAERVALAVAEALPLRRLLDTLLGELGGKALGPFPNTELFNLTGQPAASVPLHWDDRGLPVGVQLAAPLGGEAALLRLASQLEEARPWFERRPPLSS